MRSARGMVPIERIAIGDRVLGASADDLQTGFHEVTGLHQGSTRTVIAVGVGGVSIRCTAGHRFFVPGAGWVRADELRVGQPVWTEVGESVTVSHVDRVRLDRETTTYDLSVDEVSDYFVGVGEHRVLVHNGGDDEKYNRTLFWHFDRGPKVRPDDHDGMSVWKTESRDDVNTLMDHRVNEEGRKPKDDVYLCTTPDEFDRAGLVYPETPSDNALVEKLPHHSVRPADAEPYPALLTDAEKDSLQNTLQQEPAWERVKPKEVTGC